MTYQIAPFPVTFSELEGHSPSATVFKCDFSQHNCVASGKISTEVERRAVPLR